MEYIIFLFVVAIFVETTILTVKRFQKFPTSRRKIYVDTSSLMDGRILNVARTGFIDGDLLILDSVLRELQLLADGRDGEKRTRARAGLEIVPELERVVEVNAEVVEDTSGEKKVDEALLKLAKQNRATIITMDYNLIKVADAEKIPTLNINELALGVRDNIQTGEKAEIKIISKGQGQGQGVGYYNGIMVIVENASGKIGREIKVEFLRVVTTPSGRLVFARPATSRRTTTKPRGRANNK